MVFSLGEVIATVTYYCLIGTSGLVTNTWMIVVMYKTRQYRESLSTYYLYNILIVGILACLFVVPYYIISIVIKLPSAASKDKYETACKVSVFLIYSISNLKIYLLTAMSLDRYFAVIHPYFYIKHASKRNITLIITFFWISAITIMMPLPITNGLTKYFGITGVICGVQWGSIDKSYFILGFLFIMVVPSAIMVLTNIRVYLTARKQHLAIHYDRKRYSKRETSIRRRKSSSRPGIANSKSRASEINLNDAKRHENIRNDAELEHSANKCELRKKSGYGTMLREMGGTSRENRVNEGKFGNGNKTSDADNRSLESDKQNNEIGNKIKSIQTEDIDDSGCTPKANEESATTKPCENSVNAENDARQNRPKWSVICSTLLLVLAFFITWLPFVISRFYEAFTSRLGDKVVVYTCAVTILDVILNPIIILATRRKLRKSFLHCLARD